MNQLLIGIILAFGITGYFYYNQTQTELTELRTQVLAYEMKFAVQEDTINTLQEQHAIQTDALVEMAENNRDIIAERDRYLDVFRRHDLAKLANAKPGMLEPRVNNATKKVFESLEKDSTFDFSAGAH